MAASGQIMSLGVCRLKWVGKQGADRVLGEVLLNFCFFGMFFFGGGGGEGIACFLRIAGVLAVCRFCMRELYVFFFGWVYLDSHSHNKSYLEV